MDIEVQGEFSLGEFSVKTLEFVPEVNCVLASNGCGEIASVNVVTGSVQKFKGKLLKLLASWLTKLYESSCILVFKGVC